MRKVATNDFNVKTKQLWINQQFGTNVLRGEDWSLHWGAIICQAKLHAGYEEEDGEWVQVLGRHGGIESR